MNIHHSPISKVTEAEQFYSNKDGVPVLYVCTTDLNASDVPVDVFYRETPHPKFGNRYFGLYFDNYRGAAMVCNADIVETFDFAMITGPDGRLYYSQSHHDHKAFDNAMIDGGRVYIRGHNYDVYKIKNGAFVKDYGEAVTNFVHSKDDYVYPGSDPQV